MENGIVLTCNNIDQDEQTSGVRLKALATQSVVV